MHLSVILGAAVTAAVLTGALAVGDSVRESLRTLTEQRLGDIDFSFTSSRFFREKLGSDLLLEDGLRNVFQEVSAAILLQGSASHADSKRFASNVRIQGIEDRFADFFPDSELSFQPNLNRERAVYPPAVINEALADELAAEVGDSILISFSRHASVNPEYVLGSRDPTDLYETARVSVQQILSDGSLGDFSLQPNQSVPLNVFLPLNVVQEAIDQEGSVNALLMSANENEAGDVEEAFRVGLANRLRLDDVGLAWRRSEADAVLESREMIISPVLEEKIRATAEELELYPLPVLTYLANSLSAGPKSIPYSTVSAIGLDTKEFRDRFRLLSGEAVPTLQADEILINEWAGSQLEARVGDMIALTYYTVDWRKELHTEQQTFRLRGVIRLEGLAADTSLTPDIPGVQDAEDIASWEPPIPIDLDKIRAEDEQYWDDHRAAPKAFVSYDAGSALWSSRFGRVTSFRFAESWEEIERIERTLLSVLDPESIGAFRAVKAQGLRAAVGATDFRMLFIGFSLFLIVSAVLLVGLLFGLGLENRVREIGVLFSLGYSLGRVRQIFLSEGFVLATIGALFGLGGAVVYTGLLILGLQTLWLSAIGNSFLRLHITWFSLVLGLLVSVLGILLAQWLTFRRLARLPAISLLAGSTANRSRSVSPSRSSSWVLGAALLMTIGLLGASFLAGSQDSVLLFYGVGVGLLTTGLTLFSRSMRKGAASPIRPGPWTTLQTAVRNAARNSGRSLLSVTLVASACFVIVAVGANRSVPGEELLEKTSGAGGFAARAVSDVPLVRDLNQDEALFDLGFSDPEIEKLGQTRFYAFRLLPGEDVSCRNLYQPTKPRVLGVPDQLLRRGGFRFQSLSQEAENPWSLLQDELDPDVIPAFGDANSVMWILHLGLGDELTLTNESGGEVRLRLVGLLSRSIFQSELLVSEANFQKYFPGRRGYSYFLVETPAEDLETIGGLLEDKLNRFGYDLAPTSQILTGFLAVENTYLSTFQTLGGLGLLLGTLGLAVILVRNTLERRTELATMSAFGFQRLAISLIVFFENCFLLVLGIVIGTLSALVAVAPHLLENVEDLPVSSLSLTLLSVLAVGTVASFCSTWIALRRPLLPALRGE